MSYFSGIKAICSLRNVVVFCAILGTSSAACSQSVYDVPTKFVNACYDWLKGRNEVGDLSPQQLSGALQKAMDENPAIPGRTIAEQGAIEAAIQWSETLMEKKDCYRRNIGILNVQAAVDGVQRERAELQEKEKAEATAKFLRDHADDPVTVDYNEYVRSVAGVVAKPRKPAGTVKSLKLSQYLAWEKQMKDKWAAAVMNAGGSANAMQMHTQCKNDVATQWRGSFGYDDALLRSPALTDKGVSRSLVTSIACMTEYLRAAGIPATNELSNVGAVVRF